MLPPNEQFDMLRALDRDTLDTLLITNRRLHDVVTDKMQGFCLREIATVTINKRNRRDDYHFEVTLTWPEDSEEEDDFNEEDDVDEEANAARSLEFTHPIPNEDHAHPLKNALRNCCISGSMKIYNVHLTPELLDFFTSAVANIRLNGSLDLFEVSAEADDSVRRLIETLQEVRKVNLDISEDLTSQQLDDNFLRACLDKGCARLEYPTLCASPMVTDDAVIDFISGSETVHDSARYFGIHEPNLSADFVSKCVERHLSCPYNVKAIFKTNLIRFTEQRLENVEEYVVPTDVEGGVFKVEIPGEISMSISCDRFPPFTCLVLARAYE